MKGFLWAVVSGVISVANVVGAEGEGPGTYFEPAKGSANVAEQVKAKPGAVRKTVAFLGGSITEMNGFRPLVMKRLREKYPTTDFVEIAAGLSSTCSDAGAYRLEEDVLAKGTPDLFVVEAAVNDEQDGHFDSDRCIRGMEGAVRHVREINPACAVVVGLMVNKDQYESLLAGKVPVAYAAHARVARRYGAAVANVGLELAASARKGGFSWNEYRDCHPSPEGCAFAAKVVLSAIDKVFDPTKPAEVFEQPRPMDEKSYWRGTVVPAKALKLGDGWQASRPDWEKIPGSKRATFTQGEAIWSETVGAELSFSFVGTAAALFLTAGPDAGNLEASVDDGPFVLLKLRADWPPLHYPYVHNIADELPDGPHAVRLRVASAERGGKACSAVRIHRVYVNGRPSF